MQHFPASQPEQMKLIPQDGPAQSDPSHESHFKPASGIYQGLVQ
jgi:hypothetical protein